MFAAEKGEKNKKKVKTKDKSPLLEFPNAAADVQPYAFTKSSDCDGDGGGTAASTKGVRGVHGVGKKGGSATCADRIC
ncbi:uncharacterized protein LOC105797193 isoform X2 [Gossypium raimondii]|uniref:uncharacterized protein LOC105797193 isoform X2 n=1 Tax=Gossypium raimondii TaxID=29730 RepID=UPI00063AB6EC|nr:uncharacterized protein LOC105797193 isoform X2 [Gossypium raimondii]